MPYSLDTNIINVRDVFALNNSGEFIPRDSVPVIGNEGYVEWKSSFEFLGTSSLELLHSIQPGFSTLSTNFTNGFNNMLNNIDLSDYITHAFLRRKITLLTKDYGYISSTCLYKTIQNLSKLDIITESVAPMALFLASARSNFPGIGYVSTVNPGSYRNYYSTMGFTPGSAQANDFSLTLDMGGFQILSSSKMKIDINANVSVTTSVNTNFSTFLYTDRPIGTPVVVDSDTSFTMSKFTFFLTAADLDSARQISLKHRISNGTITVKPISVDVRLINMD